MHDTNRSGLVFDIKRFAIHDGPGIRTTAFLKGCPLSCPWCQNPEGIARERELWYTPSLCIQCGTCITSCPNQALSAGADIAHFIDIDRTRCSLAGECIRTCPTGSLSWMGTSYSVEELVDIFLRDRVFYDSSGGGITLSGGEPLLQAPFTTAVLAACKENDLHTALETTLFAPRRVVETIAELTDHVLADIKIWDSAAHRRVVGVDIQSILDNIRFLANRGSVLTIRIPLIPGVTATEENVRPIARFVAALPGDIPLELINFNPLASGKYRALAKEYEFSTVTAPLPLEDVEALAHAARQEGVLVV